VTKAKATAQKKTIRSRAASAELDSSSLSDPDNDEFNLNADDASTADDEPDDEELFNVTGSMSENEARKLLDNEVTVFLFSFYFYDYSTIVQVPRDPSTLFDDDDGVEMASSWHSRQTSSEASRPPTSESEGMFDNQDESDEDEEPKVSGGRRKPGKATKVYDYYCLHYLTDLIACLLSSVLVNEM
jgi:hypothetical protein